VSLDASALITGNLGPNAQQVLAEGGILVYQVGNGATVREALAALESGSLTRIEAPTVSGHWS
jgi:predicted Fe-Mo cluster-binding NifX family protein